MISEKEIDRFQRILEPLPKDPKTHLEYTIRAQWLELEAMRRRPSITRASQQAETFRHFARLVDMHGPGTPAELEARQRETRTVAR